MFGQDWDHAEATIVARDSKFTGDGAVATYTFVADVRLPSGETFRATVNEPTIATDFWAPSIGDVVSVLVRTKDHKVKFDKDDERLSVKAARAARKSAFEEAQQQTAGTPAAAWPAPGDTAALPPGIAEKLAQLGITGAGSMHVVAADSAEGQAALAAITHPAAPLQQTVEERLARLSNLRDQGLVTAEEYADQRRRILEEI